jgi:hypothetical protein
VKSLLSHSPGAVGPASRLRRRYADAPAAAILTGLATADWPSLRCGADALFLKSWGLRLLAVKVTARKRGAAVIIGARLVVDSGGSLVGAIGVSGAPGGDADEACAKAGIEAIQGKLDF